jgi:large subunit ribosomal protein L13
MNRTTFFNKENKSYQWFVFDAGSKPLGRLCTEIAQTLLGKNSVQYSPGNHLARGVIVVNAEKVFVTGKKTTDKFYYRHSGTPGGLTVETFKSLKDKHPSRIIEQSVKKMLPKNSLGRELFTKLKVYPTSQHPHIAQKPTLFSDLHA